MIEAAEIALLLRDSTLSQPSSAQLGWDGLAIERRTVQPSEKPEVTLGHHYLVLWDQHVAEGEIRYRGGQFTPYRKYPGMITTCLPEVRLAARNRSKHEVIVCSMDPAFLHGVEEEMDKHPGGTIHRLNGQYDAALRELLLLLLGEAEVGGMHGKLYLDSLSTALATRLIYGRRSRGPPVRLSHRSGADAACAGHRGACHSSSGLEPSRFRKFSENAPRRVFLMVPPNGR